MARTAATTEHPDRRAEVLSYIHHCEVDNHRAPTYKEIGSQVGLNSNGAVDFQIQKLINEHKLIKLPGARGLRVVNECTCPSQLQSTQIAAAAPTDLPEGKPTHTPFALRLKSVAVLAIPGLGPVAAGVPIETPGQNHAGESPLFSVDVPESYIPRGVDSADVYALRVAGESMRDAMIADGDIVLIHRTKNINNGDIVVAWLLEEHTTTLKRITRTENTLWLEPENPSDAYKRTSYNPQNVDIQGKLLCVLRLTP
jgi:repressor LexA